MDIRVLRFFLAVAREESITGAAEALHMTQPNLSRQLKELEEELGATLFQRGRSITLTDEGVILRTRAEEMVELMEKTKQEVNSSVENIGGDIHIGCAETDAMRLLIRAMKTVQQKYPAVRFHIVSGHADIISERLDRGLLDFGVFMEPTNLQKYDFLRLPVADTWGVLMRKDDPLAAKKSISPEDLIGIPLISSNQALVRNELAGWTGGSSERFHVVATYNLLYNASLMVEEGLGYALCLDKIIPTTEERPLCFRPLEPKLEAGISVGWKRYQVFSKAAERFLECLRVSFVAEN